MSRPRSPKRKATRILLAFLMALGATALLCVLLWPRERLLLTIAHKLPLSADTFLVGNDQSDTGWRSNHEQLLLRHAPNADHDTIWVRDVWTGQETLLQPFNDRFASRLKLIPRFITTRGVTVKSKPTMNYTMLQQRFSPDGKWMLWQDSQTWRAFALDGSAQREWPRDPQENHYRHELRWVLNGQSWMLTQYDAQFHINGVMLHSLEAAALNGERAFAQSAGQWALGTTQGHHLLTRDRWLGRFIPQPPVVSSYTLYDTDLVNNHVPTRKLDILMPPGTVSPDVWLSPDGTRLLWQMQIRQEPPGPLPIQTFLRRCGMETRRQNALWVSNTDGTNMREVGHITAEPIPPPPPAKFGVTAVLRNQLQQRLQLQTTPMYGIQWLPDSKHALFVRGNEVYQVDVE